MRAKTGNYSKATHTSKTIGIASTSIVGANDLRKYLLLQNDSNEIIYIKLGETAVASEGIRIPVGGSYEMNDGDGNIFVGAINGICATGGKVLLVTEGV
jgi:hypothetical protein